MGFDHLKYLSHNKNSCCQTNKFPFSEEQEFFIEKALEKHNILVDACIGSGKTTTIQEMCNRYLARYKENRILYLTYNKLLKLDARKKIINRGVQVTNYHGFAYTELVKIKVSSGISNIIQTYNQINPKTQHYDLMVIDEYQDIEEEVSYMLGHIQSCCPGIQIIAVGDMAQKIYDKTRLNVDQFISDFLGNDCLRMEFTQCFRINKTLAAVLGKIWKKTIIGVNENCRTYCMTFDQIKDYLIECSPKEILCLGQNTGERSAMLNYLEETRPDKFNKNTVWSNTSDNDSCSTSPSPECAIFTTYDGCKGMERNICVIFDWTESYWQARTEKPNTRYEIIRNVFCVAASRGKNIIIFADKKDGSKLKEETIMDETQCLSSYDDMQISTMFDYRITEYVEDTYKCLEIKEIKPPKNEIPVKTSDGMIDLASCVGIYQEANYFQGYDVTKDINQYFEVNRNKNGRKIHGFDLWNIDKQILYLISLETSQYRYLNQVNTPFVQKSEWELIQKRLSSEFSQYDTVQKNCQIKFLSDKKDENGDFEELFTATGMCDVIKERKDGVHGNAVYELKFVSELSHQHFLQCACYMVAFGFEVGYLYNIYNDQMIEIRIPDIQKFMDNVIFTVTKGTIRKFRGDISLKKYIGKKSIDDSKKTDENIC